MALLVGEAPGAEEVKDGHPFVGRAGIELWRALGSLGYRRDRFSISNVVLCRPPNNELGHVLRDVAKENKRRAKAGEPLVMDPRACCAPRLARETAAQPRVIALGAVALQATVGHAASIMDARGGPLELPALRVMPCLHPAFVMRAKRWRAAFRADLARAIRWFTSGLAWRDPRVIVSPSAAELRVLLATPPRSGYRVFDVETRPAYPEADVYEPTKDRLRCIGIGDPEGVVVILFERLDGSRVYEPAEEAAVRKTIAAWLSDPFSYKAGWNSGVYDRMVCEGAFGVTPQGHLDGIVLSKLAEPELPHDLGYAGSVYTDVHKWKAGKPAENAQTDEELVLYNARDVAVTHLCIPVLAERMVQRGMDRPLHPGVPAPATLLPKVQDICVGLHKAGMYVDEKRRAEWDRKLLAEAQARVKEIRERIGRPSFNPGSVPQLQDLLFEEWGLLPHHYSKKTGEPSTDDEALRYYMTKGATSPAQRAVIYAERRFRNATKLRGTYVLKLRPITDPPVTDLFAWDEEAERRHAEKGLAPGLRQEDGRIHASYLAHGTVGWRLSSNSPNCFSSDTEVLTRGGWIRFDALPRGVEVAQWNEGRIAFVVPVSYVERDAAPGEVVTIRNQHIRLQVTADHRCLLRHRKTGERRVFPAAEYPGDWEQIHAGIYAGPGLALSADEITVLCAMQADGAWDGEARPGMDFSFHRQRKIDRLVAALGRLSAPHSIRASPVETAWGVGTRVRIRVGTSPLVSRILSLLGREKVFSWGMLFAMSTAEIRAFISECYLWDGSETRRNCYSSSVRRNAEVFQAAVAISGERAHWRIYEAASGRPNYQVDVTDRDYSLTTNVERARSAGGQRVYCLSVPSSFILVRREGEIMVTGQCQNFPDRLRDMIVAGPGHVLVGCDEAQLELRMVAADAKDEPYLEAFASGGDPHLDFCIDFFGDHFREASKDHKKELRRFVKEGTYSSLYLALPETVHETLISSEDRETGELVFPDLDPKTTWLFHDKWKKAHPAIEKWWAWCISTWEKQKWLAEPVLGLRCDFLDGLEAAKVVNLRPQSGGSGLVHLATLRVLEEIPFEKWGPGTGIIQQGHDSLVVECPEAEAEKVKAIMERCMSFPKDHFPGLPIPFVGEAKSGHSWKEV